MTSGPSFLNGDRPSPPPKTNRSVICLIRDNYTLQCLISIGICLQTLCHHFIPHPYTYIPAICILATTIVPNVLSGLGVLPRREESTTIVGKTAAYLDFSNPVHAGKRPGAPALTHEKNPPRLALMLIGSRCTSGLGAFQPEFVEMGDTISRMIDELRAASPEEDTGFLNLETYMHATNSSNNALMYCIYWKSYEHIYRFAHKANGTHYPAWEKFRKLQREREHLSTKIGIWHEIYEVSNAEGIYQNMPRMGLGDLWDAVRTEDGRIVYRNSLVTGTGGYATSNGRLGFSEKPRAQGVSLGTTLDEKLV